MNMLEKQFESYFKVGPKILKIVKWIKFLDTIPTNGSLVSIYILRLNWVQTMMLVSFLGFVLEAWSHIGNICFPKNVILQIFIA